MVGDSPEDDRSNRFHKFQLRKSRLHFDMGFRRQSRLLRWAGFLFLLDCFFVWVSFLLGIRFRFGEFSLEKLSDYGLGVASASIILPSLLYIGGLYSTRQRSYEWINSLRWLLIGFAGAVASVLIAGSLDFSARMGRGVLIGAMPVLAVLISLRHLVLIGRKKDRYQTWLCMVTNEVEEKSAEKLCEFLGDHAKTFGILTGGGYTSTSSIPCLGTTENIHDFRSLLRLDAILVRDRHFEDKNIAAFLSQPALRRCRYCTVIRCMRRCLSCRPSRDHHGPMALPFIQPGSTFLYQKIEAII